LLEQPVSLGGVLGLEDAKLAPEKIVNRIADVRFVIHHEQTMLGRLGHAVARWVPEEGKWRNDCQRRACCPPRCGRRGPSRCPAGSTSPVPFPRPPVWW